MSSSPDTRDSVDDRPLGGVNLQLPNQITLESRCASACAITSGVHSSSDTMRASSQRPCTAHFWKRLVPSRMDLKETNGNQTVCSSHEASNPDRRDR